MKAIALICPGVHAPSLTQSFVSSINWQGIDLLVFPSDLYPAYSGADIYQFLNQNQIERTTEIIALGFSAGVVGAISGAWLWQLWGGKVKAVIAFDGWGMPVFGFEVYRFSHDYFTHVTSAWLGSGRESFYADPPVAHLDLWRSPALAQGYSLSATASSDLKSNNAASHLEYLLQKLSSK